MVSDSQTRRISSDPAMNVVTLSDICILGRDLRLTNRRNVRTNECSLLF